MRKILVVLTGGTIGSKIEGSVINVTEASPFDLLDLYKETYGSCCAFEVIQPFTLLSENMNLQYYSQLARVMWELPYKECAGVIVTHGSDTLSYTAALLGMLLRHVSVPVVLIAANYPLGDKRSNGLANFKSAVDLIRGYLLRGVYCVYRSNKGENNVYLGTRMTEADAYLDQFGSFGGVPLGMMEEGSLCYNGGVPNPTLPQIRDRRSPIVSDCPVFEKTVLMIRSYPGLDYRSIDLGRKPAAVICYLYHSATGCTQGEGTSILDFIDRCHGEGIPVYAASAKIAAKNSYVTAKAIRERGVTLLGHISPEAAYAKVLLLHNIGTNEEAKRRIKDTIFFENLPFPEDLI